PSPPLGDRPAPVGTGRSPRSAVRRPALLARVLAVVLGAPVDRRTLSRAPLGQRPLHLEAIEQRIEAHGALPHPGGQVAFAREPLPHGAEREVAGLDRGDL